MFERSLYRIGAWAIVAGAVVSGVFNLLHPRVDDYTDFTRAELEMIAGNGPWVALHMALLLGVLLIIGGLVAVGRSIEGPRGAALGRLAMAGAVVGGAVGAVVLGYDGIVMKRLANLYAEGGDAAAGALAGADVGWGLFMVLNIVLLGVVPILFGVAVVAGEGYPRSLGWAALVLGAGSVVIGITGATRDPTEAFLLWFTIVSGLVILWTLVMGVLLNRKASTA